MVFKRRYYPEKDTKHATHTKVYFCFDGKAMFSKEKVWLGVLSNEAARSYLDDLNAFMPQPGACMRYHFHFILDSRPFKANNQMWLKQTLFILPVNVYPENVKFLCGATNGRQCLGNVMCGKCLDPFVRENIGKKFYEKNYSK